MVRKLSKLWRDKCNIYGFEKVKDEKTKTTEYKPVILHRDVACRISYSNISSAEQTSSVAITGQVIKLFLSNEIKIDENSNIEVIRNGVAKMYKASGTPALYSIHQEVILVNADRGA